MSGANMAALRQDAYSLLERMPDEKLMILIQFMQSIDEPAPRKRRGENSDVRSPVWTRKRNWRNGGRRNLVMRALIDTNVLIDFISKRGVFYADARKIVDTCDRGIYDGCIAAHSVPDIFYILRKSVPVAERREALRLLCEIFTVVGINKRRLISALNDENFSDFEDCLQSLCAETFRADYIVTRNPKDFEQSMIPAITPDVFCRRFLDNLPDEEGDQ